MCFVLFFCKFELFPVSMFFLRQLRGHNRRSHQSSGFHDSPSVLGKSDSLNHVAKQVKSELLRLNDSWKSCKSIFLLTWPHLTFHPVVQEFLQDAHQTWLTCLARVLITKTTVYNQILAPPPCEGQWQLGMNWYQVSGISTNTGLGTRLILAK